MAIKFLEGKTPSERKKIIAALALGLLTICALSYTFLFSSSSAQSGNKSNKNGGATAKNSPTPSKTGEVVPPEDVRNQDDGNILLEPIPVNPFAVSGAPDAARNIFAFYEPPPPRIATPTPEKPIPTPTPTPPIPFLVSYINPNTVFAHTDDFTIEVGGDKFTPAAKVLFNGQELPTEFSSPQRLTAKISAQLISSEGQRQITVRTPDGLLYSNPVIFNVQAPPVPNYNYVGLVARKRYNNDTALLQNKQTKEYLSVRLNDPLPDRFRVVSISSNEVWVQDTALKLKHRLAYIDEKSAGKSGVAGGVAGQGQGAGRGGNGMMPGAVDPNMQYQEIPGIPNNIPRYIPPQPQPQSKDDEDVDDDNPNQ